MKFSNSSVAVGLGLMSLMGTASAWASPTDDLGAQGAQVVGGDVLAGTCRIEDMSTPLDDGSGGGIPFDVQAAGTAVGRDVAATEVSCRVIQRGAFIYNGFSGYLQGPSNALRDSFTETTLAPLETCVQISEITTPGGGVVHTIWMHADGTACSVQ